MLQTLLRIRFDDFWTLEPIDNITGVGVGWILVLWIVVGAVWLVRALRQPPNEREGRPAIVMWATVAAVILAAPIWGPRIFPQGIPVYGYGFMLFLAFVAAGWTAGRRAESVGISREFVWDAGVWMFVAGIVGARLFYVTQFADRVFVRMVDGRRVPLEGFDKLLAIINLPDGGLVFYGGVLGGIAAFILYCRVKKLPTLRMADVFVPSVFVGLAFGRMGCFLNGCCFGDRCDLPWAVVFPQGSVPFVALVDRGLLPADAAATFPLHPAQLYSVANALALALLTHAYFRYRHKDGAVLAVGWLVYPITRFVLEYLRSDELGQFGTTLTISQWVSIAMFASGLVFTAWLNFRPRAELFPAATTARAGTA